MKKQQLTTKTSEFVVPTTDKDTNITDKEFEVWPTPSGLHLLSALFSTAPAAKPIQRESLKGRYIYEHSNTPVFFITSKISTFQENFLDLALALYVVIIPTFQLFLISIHFIFS